MKPKKQTRFTDFFPALTIWLTFIGLFALSFVQPLWAIYLIVIFVVYWIIRLFYMMIWLVISWIRYRHDSKVNWLAELKNLEKDHRDYYHVIIYPTIREPYELIARTFNELLKTNYPKDKMIVCLGGEGVDEENFLQIASRLEKDFGDKFYKLLITVHHLADDELQGKGSNVNYIERQVKKFIDEKKLDYEKVIVSCFDIETIASENYFAYLTYKYLTHPNPTRVSYQPLILYNNNIWESNPIIRVVASATTFWLLTDLSRPERLLTFSSHSMSWQMLMDVGGHDKTIVTEDSRICLQAIDKYDGDYEVLPMYVTLSMDTVYVGSFWKSMKDQYKQMRRWAWGVEHFPWMWKTFFSRQRNRKIPVKKRIFYMWNQFEGMYSWAVAPFLILIFGRVPLWLSTDADKAMAFFQNAPITLERLMAVGMVGLVLNAVLYTFLLPIRPKEYRPINYLIMLGQWIVFPVTMIVFGSIPAIDAQSRLMFGGKWRLGFWATKKKA